MPVPVLVTELELVLVTELELVMVFCQPPPKLQAGCWRLSV